MTHKDFTYKELLGEAYSLTRRHFVFLLGLLAINIVIGWVTAGIPLINQLVSIALSMATTWVMLLIVGEHTPKYKDLLHPFKKNKVALNYFLATMLMYLIFVLGVFIPTIGYAVSRVTSDFLVFGISGFIFLLLVLYYGARLSFFGFFILENENVGPVDALKKSFHMTRNRFWKLAGYIGILLLLNLAGLIAFVIGLAFTLPMTWIAIALLYKRWNVQAHPTEGHHLASQ